MEILQNPQSTDEERRNVLHLTKTLADQLVDDENSAKDEFPFAKPAQRNTKLNKSAYSSNGRNQLQHSLYVLNFLIKTKQNRNVRNFGYH